MGIVSHRKILELLGLGISKPDAGGLMTHIHDSQHVLHASNESMVKGDEKFRIFADFSGDKETAHGATYFAYALCRTGRRRHRQGSFKRHFSMSSSSPSHRLLYIIGSTMTLLSSEVCGCKKLLQANNYRRRMAPLEGCGGQNLAALEILASGGLNIAEAEATRGCIW